MMTFARAVEEGLELAFADGRSGVIPFADIPELGSLSDVVEIDLPNPYEVILHDSQGHTVELPWDFARHYCDASYPPRVAEVAAAGRLSIGRRIRQLREARRITQEDLAAAAGVGRVTLVRIERGEQSPRFDTLAALAQALGRPLAELLVGDTSG